MGWTELHAIIEIIPPMLHAAQCPISSRITVWMSVLRRVTQSYLALSTQQKSFFVFWMKFLNHAFIWSYSFQEVRWDKPSLLVQLSLQDQQSFLTSGFLADEEIVNRGAVPRRDSYAVVQEKPRKTLKLEGTSANFITQILAYLWNNSECKNTEESKRKGGSKLSQMYSSNMVTSTNSKNCHCYPRCNWNTTVPQAF